MTFESGIFYEAHKYALRCHIKSRTNTSLKSFLEQIPGIGPQKRKLLIDRKINPFIL